MYHIFLYSSDLSTVTWRWPWPWLKEHKDPHFGNACFHQRHFSQFLQGFCVTEFHFTGADPGVEGNVFKTEATT